MRSSKGASFSVLSVSMCFWMSERGSRARSSALRLPPYSMSFTRTVWPPASPPPFLSSSPSMSTTISPTLTLATEAAAGSPPSRCSALVSHSASNCGVSGTASKFGWSRNFFAACEHSTPSQSQPQ